MKNSLAVIRSEIINAYKHGKDNADRKLGNRQINQRIFDVRNKLIMEYYGSTKIIDVAWLQWITVTITKQTDATGNRFVSANDIPQIINLGTGDAGFYQVKPKGLMFEKITSFFLKPASQLETIRNNRYTGSMNYAARENNKLILVSRAKSIGEVLLGAVLANPEDDPNFTENSVFPFSAELIDEIIKRVVNFDISINAGTNNDQNNDSTEQINLRKTPTGQQQ